MKIKPFSTGDVKNIHLNVLIYGHAGAGKTTALGHFQETFGKGLILSGEGGLASIADKNIDFLPFYSFDHPVDQKKYPGGHSFKDLMAYLTSDEFKNSDYKWVAIDSFTELSRRAFTEATLENDNPKDGFKKYDLYTQKIDPMINDLRDLPIHVVCTALATESKDENGMTNFWPMLHQKSKVEAFCGTFDVVAALINKSETVKTEEGKTKMKMHRYTLTGNVSGWHGKTRDCHGRIRVAEEGTNVASLVQRLVMNKEEFENTKKQGIAA